MLLAVNERVPEIGLRRAVGRAAARHPLQFLVETAVTALGGGLGGVVLGSAVAAVAWPGASASRTASRLAAIALGLALAARRRACWQASCPRAARRSWSRRRRLR